MEEEKSRPKLPTVEEVCELKSEMHELADLDDQGKLSENDRKAAEKKLRELFKNSGYVRELVRRSDELKAMPEDERRLEEAKIAKNHFDRIRDSFNKLPRKGKRKLRGKDQKYSSRVKKRLALAEAYK